MFPFSLYYTDALPSLLVLWVFIGPFRVSEGEIPQVRLLGQGSRVRILINSETAFQKIVPIDTPPKNRWGCSFPHNPTNCGGRPRVVSFFFFSSVLHTSLGKGYLLKILHLYIFLEFSD